jgi:hypothetical protein
MHQEESLSLEKIWLCSALSSRWKIHNFGGNTRITAFVGGKTISFRDFGGKVVAFVAALESA